MNYLQIVNPNPVIEQPYARDLTLDEIEMVEGGNPVAVVVGVVVAGGLGAALISGSNYSQSGGYSFSGAQAADAWRSTMAAL